MRRQLSLIALIAAVAAAAACSTPTAPTSNDDCVVVAGTQTRCSDTTAR